MHFFLDLLPSNLKNKTKSTLEKYKAGQNSKQKKHDGTFLLDHQISRILLKGQWIFYVLCSVISLLIFVVVCHLVF